MLGGLQLTCPEGQVTHFRLQKVGLLLACLALQRRAPQTREVVCALLWPDAELEAARHNLRQALSSLRAIVGELIVTEGYQSIGLAPHGLVTDVAELEAQLWLASNPESKPHERRQALEAVKRLYKGDLLPGYYEDWVQTERERLRARYDKVESLLTEAPLLPVPPPPPMHVPATTRRVQLPLTLSRYWGRDTERRQLQVWLEERVRLITLTGPGGMGKTRLALVAAQDVPPSFDLVLYVPLAEITNSNGLGGRILELLGETPLPGLSAIQQLTLALQRLERPLLILDNLEQLDAGDIVTALLGQVPLLQVLATSRTPLGLSGEQELPLTSLPSESSAALFVDRVRTIRPSFAPTETSLPVIQELVQQLDGLPLALELAAARTRILSLEQIKVALDECGLSILASDRRDLPGRHRTLEATIQWSYELLSEKERCLFRTLSVFRGGWTAEAVTQVAQVSERETLDILEQLVRHSLVLSDESGRFRFLELTRVFAQGLLIGDEKHVVQRQHVAWIESLESWDSEGDNLRAALEFLLGEDLPRFVVLHNKSVPFFFFRQLWGEWEQWAERALEKTDATALQAALHVRILQMAGLQGNREKAETHGKQALVQARRAEIPLLEVQAEVFLAQLWYRMPDKSLPHFYRALELRQRYKVGPPLADIYADLALTAYLDNQLEQAQELCTQGLATLENADAAYLLATQGKIFWAQGRYEDAASAWATASPLVWDEAYLHATAQVLLSRHHLPTLRQAIEDRLRRPDAPYRWHYFPELALVAQEACHDTALAATLHGAHQRQLEDLNEPLAPIEAAARLHHFPTLRASLGDSAFNEHFSRGYNLSWEAALTLFLTLD